MGVKEIYLFGPVGYLGRWICEMHVYQWIYGDIFIFYYFFFFILENIGISNIYNRMVFSKGGFVIIRK